MSQQTQGAIFHAKMLQYALWCQITWSKWGTCKMRNETKLTKTKRNGIIQNEIKPILTKEFLGEIQDKN